MNFFQNKRKFFFLYSEEKTSLLSTEGEEHVQQWIDHTDTIPWENSSTTTSVLDHGTTLPFSVVDQEHQRTSV